MVHRVTISWSAIRKFGRGGCVTIALLLTGCAERTGNGWHEKNLPLILVVDDSVEAVIGLDSVRAVPAPPVEFAALTVRDRHHGRPILAEDSGIVLQIRSGPVEPGDSLVWWSYAQGHDSVAISCCAGQWVPRRKVGDRFWPRDTLGLIEEDGFWVAEGAVNDYEGQEIHPGDPGLVRLWGDPDSLLPAHVEWVRRPFTSSGNTSVGVEFVHARDSLHRGVAAMVTVTPSGPQDSLPAAPDKALARLSNGLAVFLPAGPHRYEVRFVFIGPFLGNRVILREGLFGKEVLVVRGVEILKRVADDSLRQRRLRQ